MSKIKNFLLLVNPYSGLKKGEEIVQKILPILNKHSINPNILYTEHKGHAKEICRSNFIKDYSDLILIGGDGTFSEAINGLLLREDKIYPNLGFIPGGSGNSLMHHLNILEPVRAVQSIIENKIKYLDVVEITSENFLEYSINIVGWGVATDIGATAEKIRWMGRSRYTLASLYHILKLKKRHAALTLNGAKQEKQFIFILVCNTQYTGTGMQAAPNAQLNDGMFDVIILNQNISRLELMQLLPKIFTGEHIQSKHVEYVQTDTLKLEPRYSEALNIDGEIKLSTPISLKILKGILTYYHC